MIALSQFKVFLSISLKSETVRIRLNLNSENSLLETKVSTNKFLSIFTQQIKL